MPLASEPEQLILQPKTFVDSQMWSFMMLFFQSFNFFFPFGTEYSLMKLLHILNPRPFSQKLIEFIGRCFLRVKPNISGFSFTEFKGAIAFLINGQVTGKMLRLDPFFLIISVPVVIFFPTESEPLPFGPVCKFFFLLNKCKKS